MKIILWKFKEEPETRKGFPCQAFRWTFQVNLWTLWTIGFVHQSKSNGKWHDSHTRVFEMGISSHFKLGMDHFYYDGCHCQFSLGWLWIMWGGGFFTGMCKKCMPHEFE